MTLSICLFFFLFRKAIILGNQVVHYLLNPQSQFNKDLGGKIRSCKSKNIDYYSKNFKDINPYKHNPMSGAVMNKFALLRMVNVII